VIFLSNMDGSMIVGFVCDHLTRSTISPRLLTHWLFAVYFFVRLLLLCVHLSYSRPDVFLKI
jgi:hypothetical protein